MRTTNSFGILFRARVQFAKEGFAPLVVRLTVDGVRTEISLKHRVPIAKWSSSKEQVSGTDSETKSLNNYIAEVRTELHNCYRKMQIDKKLITAVAIKQTFLGDDPDQKSLMHVIDYHNKTMHEVLAWGTAKNYFTTQKYVITFLKEKMNTTDVFLSQLNYKFLTDFEMYLRTHVPGENQKPCGNNTVMKHIERFRKIVSMAVRNEWMKLDPFMKFKPTFVKKDRGFLTETELGIIENKEIHNESLRTVRDLFIFSCYTGLAFADAYNLKVENMNIGIDGETWITINRQKTNVKSQVPLLPQAMQIIKRYENHPKTKAHGTLLPMMTNQRFNSYLKEIAGICNITKNLTHHLARHTFATTVCLQNGISIETTAGMMGHASIRTTQIYAKILPKRISAEMQILKNKMSNDEGYKRGFAREA
jgi:site-specific recombinase XerD